MENFQSFFGFILVTVTLVSFILILCAGGKKKEGGGKDSKKNNATSKRTAVIMKSNKEKVKPIKNEQSVKQNIKEETQQTEDPDLKSRDNYDIKTQDEKQEIEKIKAES